MNGVKIVTRFTPPPMSYTFVKLLVVKKNLFLGSDEKKGQNNIF